MSHHLIATVSKQISQAHDVMCIPRHEFDRLSKVARQYAQLRLSLVRGGVDDETLDLLSGGSTTAPRDQLSPEHSKDIPRASPPAHQKSRSHSYLNHHRSVPSSHRQACSSGDSVSPCAEDEAPCETPNATTDKAPDCINASLVDHDGLSSLGTNRTIRLLDLPDLTRHSDITATIRGGPLLEIWLTPKNRTANVSFVHCEDAMALYDHACRHGLFVRQKKVGLTWADRQFIPRPSLAHRIALGATRNLVIRQCDPNHTEESIRNDLEHIYNLVIIKVEFWKGNCFINTNSVIRAGYARTCMSSRREYKNSKIEWCSDECSESIPAAQLNHIPPQTPPHLPESPAKSRLNPLANRFDALAFEDATCY